MTQAKTIINSKIQLKPDISLFAKKKQIGLFGGTFNPIHQGHLVVAENVLDRLGLDRIDFLPSYLPPHVDPKTTINSEDRVNMLTLALKNNPFFAIEKEELIRKGKSYTIDTIKALKEKNPDTDYYFIIGGDMVEYLPKWKDIDELIQLVRFVGVNRPHYEKTSPYPIIYVDVPQLDISSSFIRQMIRFGQSPRYLLPDSVREYIQKKGLYRDERIGL